MVFTNQKLVDLTDKKLKQKQNSFTILYVLNALLLLSLFFVGVFGSVLAFGFGAVLLLIPFVCSVVIMILFFVVSYFLVPYNRIIEKELNRRKTGSETIVLRYDKLKKLDDKEIRKGFQISLVYLIVWILLFAVSIGLASWSLEVSIAKDYDVYHMNITLISMSVSLLLPIFLGAYILPNFIGTLKELRLREKR